MNKQEIVFNEKGTFAAYEAAEEFLRKSGFSIGSMQRDSPIGIMYGVYDIAKWGNIGLRDRKKLHGQINGDKRNGPITVSIFNICPAAGKKAIAATTPNVPEVND